MKPKQWTSYVRRLEKRKLAICDGVSTGFESSMFDLLYPLFIISGMFIFIWVLLHWQRIKEKITKR